MEPIKRAWTADDDAKLCKWAPEISLLRLTVKLKRSKNAVISRAAELNISVNKPILRRRGNKSTPQAFELHHR
jgi:hypothetical protein